MDISVRNLKITKSTKMNLSYFSYVIFVYIDNKHIYNLFKCCILYTSLNSSVITKHVTAKCHWIHKRCKKCLVYNTSADNFVIVCLWNDSIIWSVLWDIVETTSIVLAMRFKERTLKNSEMYRINITYKYTESI